MNTSLQNLTARFLVDSAYVVETITTDFSGSCTSYNIIRSTPKSDFKIFSFTEHKDYYDILLYESEVAFDVRLSKKIINIPKSHLTIAGKCKVGP